MATETLSRERVLEIIEECGGDKEHLLSILIEIQRECRRNYINEASARVVAEKLDIPLVQLYDILTFYAMLETKPRGRYIIEVCNNAPCYVSKSPRHGKVPAQGAGKLTLGKPRRTACSACSICRA